jgi:homoserine O-succinyltransferase
MPLTIGAYRDAAAGISPDRVHIGLINNMPDSALSATEMQFCRLLQLAAGAMPVELRLSYLPEVTRTNVAMERLRRDYWPIDELLDRGLDALIVTGTEPVALSLREEPYWQRFTAVVDWAQSHTCSSLWSCLAAHAAVEYLDAIPRRRLTHKCCGVFEHSVLPHALMRGLEAPLYTPQSRWNELPVEGLRAAGYTILSASEESGANIFCRQNGGLMVFLQGHPEYESATLVKEYRRDVERFLGKQQPHYPALPTGYFSAQASAGLNMYRQHILSGSAVARQSFPYEAAMAGVRNTWCDAAVKIYGNWLGIIAATKNHASVPVPSALSSVYANHHD